MLSAIRIQTATIILLIVCCIGVYAQTAPSSLRGVITDPSDALVTGATIVLENPQTGYRCSIASGKDGVYQFLHLQAGTYTMTVSEAGYATSKLDSLDILVNTPATANLA